MLSTWTENVLDNFSFDLILNFLVTNVKSLTAVSCFTPLHHIHYGDKKVYSSKVFSSLILGRKNLTLLLPYIDSTITCNRQLGLVPPEKVCSSDKYVCAEKPETKVSHLKPIENLSVSIPSICEVHRKIQNIFILHW